MLGDYIFVGYRENRRGGLGPREYAGMPEQDREEKSFDENFSSSWEILPRSTKITRPIPSQSGGRKFDEIIIIFYNKFIDKVESLSGRPEVSSDFLRWPSGCPVGANQLWGREISEGR